MKRRSAIIVAILIMTIGFAAISTTLIINGNVNIGENTDDFSVIFTKATLDGTDVYANVIDETKKTITFETSELKTLNQTSVLNYEVTNNSSNYDAEVQVNCKAKENTTAKYTSIKNELEGNATKVLAKETLNGTLTITLNKTATEEVREEYVCVLTFNAVERDELGQGIPNPVSFTTDSWETIQKAVKSGNTDVYNVGDIKTIELTNFGTHTLRIANKTACTTETSETACGFVVEFADIIEKHSMNNTDINTGGWENSELRTYLNSTIYDTIPSDVKNVISTTNVVSSYKTTDFFLVESSDRLYLLTSKEVFGAAKGDIVDSQTRQLDYYKNKGITLTSGQHFAIKKYNGVDSQMWLRSSNGTGVFTALDSGGNWNNFEASTSQGVSPAFRIA